MWALFRAPAVIVPRDRAAEFLQSRSNTCGAAALAYALTLFGSDTREADVLPKLRVGPQGATMADLAQAAREEGFLAWADRLNLAALRETPKPVLAHLRDDRYVVVLAFEGDRVDLFDPATGYLQVLEGNFDRQWRGDVLVIRVPPLDGIGVDKGDGHA